MVFHYRITFKNIDSKIVIVSFIVLKSEIIQPYIAFFIYDTDRWCILVSSYIVITELPTFRMKYIIITEGMLKISWLFLCIMTENRVQVLLTKFGRKYMLELFVPFQNEQNSSKSRKKMF